MIRCNGKMTIWPAALLFVVCCGPEKRPPKTPDDDPLIYYQKGVKYLNEGQCERAASEFRKSVKIDGRNSVVHNALGLAEYCNKKYDSAISCYLTAIEMNPFYTDVHNNLGIAYLAKGDFANALEEFDRALSDTHYQTPEVIYFNKGRIFYEQQNFVLAEKEFRKALEIKPENTSWRIQLCMTLEKLEAYKDAAEECRKVIEVDGDHAKAHFLLGRQLYTNLNQPVEAREHFCKVKDLVPGTQMGRAAAEMCARIPR